MQVLLNIYQIWSFPDTIKSYLYKFYLETKQQAQLNTGRFLENILLTHTWK